MLRAIQSTWIWLYSLFVSPLTQVCMRPRYSGESQVDSKQTSPFEEGRQGQGTSSPLQAAVRITPGAGCSTKGTILC